MPLCRKLQTIWQFEWPVSYGARTAIWYRQRHLYHTERVISLRHRGLSPVVVGWAPGWSCWQEAERGNFRFSFFSPKSDLLGLTEGTARVAVGPGRFWTDLFRYMSRELPWSLTQERK